MNDALLTEYFQSLQKRIERIDSLLEKLGDGNPKAEENIRLLGHSLHGSGASFGFPEISEAGKAVEYAEPGAAMQASLVELRNVLKDVVAGNTAGTTPAAVKSASSVPVPVDDDGEETRVIKVLVIEDDAEMAMLIKDTLSKLPKKQEIRVVSTAAKAQEAIVKHTFDLIIMDLLLPDRDGRELIQEIKLEFKLPTPLLVLSSIQNDAVRVECMSFGADKFLTKPFFEDELGNEVKKLLGKKIKKKLTLVPLDGEVPVEELVDDGGPGPLDGDSILLAEDDKMQANLIRQRLVGLGATLKHATNGREAMQLLRTQSFSLLILDVKMPVMDGFEVLQRVRGELKLEVPVIMVTALGSEEDIIRGYDLGATDYILKPFSEVQLVARVKSLLR